MTRSCEHCLCSYILSLVSILLFSDSRKLILFSKPSHRFSNERFSFSRSSTRVFKSLDVTLRFFIWSSTAPWILPFWFLAFDTLIKLLLIAGMEIKRDFPDAAKQSLQMKLWAGKLEPFLTHLKWVAELQEMQVNPLPLTGSWHLTQSNVKFNEMDCCFDGSDICFKRKICSF